MVKRSHDFVYYVYLARKEGIWIWKLLTIDIILFKMLIHKNKRNNNLFSGFK